MIIVPSSCSGSITNWVPRALTQPTQLALDCHPASGDEGRKKKKRWGGAMCEKARQGWTRSSRLLGPLLQLIERSRFHLLSHVIFTDLLLLHDLPDDFILKLNQRLLRFHLLQLLSDFSQFSGQVVWVDIDVTWVAENFWTKGLAPARPGNSAIAQRAPTR